MAGPCLELRDVVMRYGEGPSAVTALDSIGLCVQEGEFASIVGPSGCGKSMLLYLVGGFLRPTAVKFAFATGRSSDRAATAASFSSAIPCFPV